MGYHKDVLTRGVEHLNAEEHGDGFVYYASEVSAWVLVSDEEIADLGARLARNEEDAYSVWAAETAGEQVVDPDDDQIAALRRQARAAGDDRQVAICSRALQGDTSARIKCAQLIANAQLNSEGTHVIHVTRASAQGVYGHETKYCGESGCSGLELFWTGLDPEDVEEHSVYEIQETAQGFEIVGGAK